MDGGIKIPKVPALHMTPAAKSLLYPTFVMAAMTIEPIATTVAGEEPERAANIMHANTPAIAKPPWKWPTHAIEKRMIRLATPPVDIKLDAKIKNGIASNV